MKELTEQQKQKYQRFMEILELGKQRYSEETGINQGYRGGIRGQDYLTEEERQEAKLLLRQMFVMSNEDDYKL